MFMVSQVARVILEPLLMNAGHNRQKDEEQRVHSAITPSISPQAQTDDWIVLCNPTTTCPLIRGVVNCSCTRCPVWFCNEFLK